MSWQSFSDSKSLNQVHLNPQKTQFKIVFPSLFCTIYDHSFMQNLIDCRLYIIFSCLILQCKYVNIPLVVDFSLSYLYKVFDHLQHSLCFSITLMRANTLQVYQLYADFKEVSSET